MWLDKLVFSGEGWNPFSSLIETERFKLTSSIQVRDELVRVLERFDVDSVVALSQFDQLVTELVDLPSSTLPPLASRPLVCRDPDDQKFLDLAARYSRAIIISKDRDLLKIERRARRQREQNGNSGLLITHPDQWLLL